MSALQSPSRRKEKAENWDDDFEFSLPTKKASTPAPTKAVKNDKHSDDGWGEEEENWDESPPSASLAPPAAPPSPSPVGVGSAGLKGIGHGSPSRHGLAQSRPSSKLPAPLSIPSHAYPQPRLSPSHPSSLPSPTPMPTPPTSSSHATRPLLASRSNSSLFLAGGEQKPRSRAGSVATGSSGSGAATLGRNKLVKRHPSTSFVPIMNRSASSLILGSSAGASASPSSLASARLAPPDSTRPPVPPLPAGIPRSTSGEQMPPPPLPHSASGFGLGRSRSKSKSKPRPASRQGMPLSPSVEDVTEKEQKRGFWNRFSGVPSGGDKDATPTHRRRRSSSVGTNRTSKTPSPQPPLPPLPANLNLRSPSAASSTSTSSSNHSGPRSAFASMLRRSSSSLSKRSKESRDGPPSSYPYGYAGGASSTSVNSASGVAIPGSRGIGADGRVTPELPSSHSFSRGFHLPSPSPGSPYHSKPRHPSGLPSSSSSSIGIPPLPSSASFPALGMGQPGHPGQRSPKKGTGGGWGGGSDTEMEMVDGEKTPRRRKKIRPVSAMPAPRGPSGKGWDGESWRGFNGQGEGRGEQIPGLPRSATAAAGMAGWAASPPPPTSPSRLTFASSANTTPSKDRDGTGSGSGFASTVRRLGSLSKKHGRRLSGGFKFGTNSSSSSSDSRAHSISAGSVFGPGPELSRGQGREGRLEPVVGSPAKATKMADELETASKEIGLSKSTTSKPRPTHRPGIPSDSWDHDFPTPLSATAAATEQAMVAAAEKKKREEKNRRRQSWNDFVIPRNVMEKQKGLKEGIGAVKMFAGGVETLKTLLSTHSTLREQVHTEGSPTDTARFDSLESEFAQWWEMATVLIEVGSTGRDPSTQASLSSPPRSRRVTLASDEAKSASDALRQASASSNGSLVSLPAGIPSGMPGPHSQLLNARKISLPDESGSALPTFSQLSTGSGGPPRASPPPEQWRASTGRQDLSKRQLEVLRTMLRTPMSGAGSTSGSSAGGTVGSAAGSMLSRPGLVRGSSTLSAKGSRLGERLERRREGGTPESGGGSIKFPSPGDSAHIGSPAESPSLYAGGGPGASPSPSPNGKLKLRINTGAPLGLATAPSQASLQSVGAKTRLEERRMSKAGLAGLKEFLRSLKTKEKDGAGAGANGAVPGAAVASGERRLTPRRMMSATKTLREMVPGKKPSTSPPASPTSPLSPAFTRYSPPSAGFASSHSTTSFSALGPSTGTSSSFASSAGTNAHSGSASATGMTHSQSSSRISWQHPPPTQHPGRPEGPKRPSIRNIFRTSSGNWSELVSGNPPGTGENSPGLNKRASKSRLGQIAEQEKGRAEREREREIKREREREKAMGNLVGRTPPARGSISVSDPLPRPARAPNGGAEGTEDVEMGGGEPETGEGEMTLKPRRKSRAMGGLGLGWPEPGQGVVVGEENTPTSPWGGSPPPMPRLPSSSTDVSSLQSEGDVGVDDDGELIVALTPENLPTLLEYLRQCEMKLGEWRDRVAREGLGVVVLGGRV
ncbi:hypothetical protein IAT38_007426 [Cryptococcus sp. DSM 104549]